MKIDNSDANRIARMPQRIHSSSPRRRGTSIPEAAVIEPRGRSVLDARLRGHDDRDRRYRSSQ